jgi:hypothetical protein
MWNRVVDETYPQHTFQSSRLRYIYREGVKPAWRIYLITKSDAVRFASYFVRFSSTLIDMQVFHNTDFSLKDIFNAKGNTAVKLIQ